MKKSWVMCLKNFGPSWRFLVLFLEFPKIKSSPKTGVSQITKKYLNANPILPILPNLTVVPISSKFSFFQY